MRSSVTVAELTQRSSKSAGSPHPSSWFRHCPSSLRVRTSVYRGLFEKLRIENRLVHHFKYSNLLTYLLIRCCLDQLCVAGLRDYCNSETFSAACADDEVIVIRSALYGRMRTGRCLSHDSGVNPCWQNVIRQADRLCSGRRTCDVRVPEPSFDATQPCPRNMRVYLEIIYECVQGTDRFPRTSCMG